MIKRIFDYPAAFTTLEDYSAHRGQVVTVLRTLTPRQDHIDEPANGVDELGDEQERLYEIEASDGWKGTAWNSELRQLPRLQTPSAEHLTGA